MLLSSSMGNELFFSIEGVSSVGSIPGDDSISESSLPSMSDAGKPAPTSHCFFRWRLFGRLDVPDEVAPILGGAGASKPNDSQ